MNNEHSSVVQVLVQMTLFNWVEPYKSPDQQQLFGTGFFIDDKGHLVTSYHVVSGAASIQIHVPTLGQELFDAEITGACPERDLALLKLTDEAFENVIGKIGGIKYLELGDSDKITRSQNISTLGYPLGQNSLKSTNGIVSGRQNILGESFIQITAALNPGNSGGPSLDETGKVIGINAAIIPDAQNVGYIIPISDVKSIIEDLYKVKLLRRPLLGCDLNYATTDMTNYLSNPETGGLYISQVYKNMLMEKAGVLEGDMLYKINDYDIDMYGEIDAEWSDEKAPVASLINRFRIGENVTLVVYRKGEKKEINFTFDLLDPLPIRTLFAEFEKIDYEIIGGMVIMQLSLNHVARFGEVNPLLINYRMRQMQFEPALIITNVFANSQTYNTRTLFPGNILGEVNDQPVKTLEEFRNAVKKNRDYLRVRTMHKKFVVMSVDKILEQEEQLAQEHVYSKTQLIRDLEGNKKV